MLIAVREELVLEAAVLLLQRPQRLALIISQGEFAAAGVPHMLEQLVPPPILGIRDNPAIDSFRVNPRSIVRFFRQYAGTWKSGDSLIEVTGSCPVAGRPRLFS